MVRNTARSSTGQGESTVKVRYIMVYRDQKLINEIWQVNPGASY